MRLLLFLAVLLPTGSGSYHLPASCHRPRLARHVVAAATDSDIDTPLLDANDELKVRFSRELEPTRTSFGTTTAAVKEKPKLTQNEQLLAEIRALQPPAPPPRPEREPIDLNGIKPTDLLIGAGTYALVSYIAWQGCVGSTEWFEAHPQESSFYVVQRISSIARVVVIAMCALGSGITGIASAGQAALAVQVTIAISRGELDPDAERRMPKRRMTSVETLFSYMTGGSKRRE